jgi:hypothetical protein
MLACDDQQGLRHPRIVARHAIATAGGAVSWTVVASSILRKTATPLHYHDK